MIAGYAAFVPGLAIVYFHNRWTNGWPFAAILHPKRPPAFGLGSAPKHRG
jgi:hypothetical protein